MILAEFALFWPEKPHSGKIPQDEWIGVQIKSKYWTFQTFTHRTLNISIMNLKFWDQTHRTFIRLGTHFSKDSLFVLELIPNLPAHDSKNYYLTHHLSSSLSGR